MQRAAGLNPSRPQWLKKRIVSGSAYLDLHRLIGGKRLHTVCREACCPNQGECYSSGTATFMILGDGCTRNCRFCAVRHLPAPPAPDPGEPAAVAAAMAELELQYGVVTSVSRDDLNDGGASHFGATIAEIRKLRPQMAVEVLVPDFQGCRKALAEVLAAGPQVFNHNIETVAGLYGRVRPQARYERSLELLATAKRVRPGLITKSGIMVGLGETWAELEETMGDLVAAGCDILTIGQYLAPSPSHHPVARYLADKEFDDLRQSASSLGFAGVVAGPFVRSSYRARDTYEEVRLKRAQTAAE